MLKCYYGITIEKHWTIPEKKIQTGRGWGILEFFIFLLYPWTPGNSRQNKAQSLDIPQNCLTFVGNSKAKNKDSWKFHVFFLGHPCLGNSRSFLINPWKFHNANSFDTLRNSISSTPPPSVCFFFWNCPLMIIK